MTKKSADINYISKDLFPKTYNRTMIDDDYIKHLEQENKQLKTQISVKEKEYKKLDNNWNKLKAFIVNEILEEEFVNNEYYVSILDKMQELERF